MKDKFTRLQHYYDNSSPQPNCCFKITELGLYMPSNLELVREGVESLFERKIIFKNDLFLDAGSGDGRIVSLLAGIFDVPTVGVEYDASLAEISRGNIRYLQQMGVIGETRAEIIHGDFKRDFTYNSQAINFADFSVIFNYINNQKDIAQKIVSNSKDGTRFLLFDACSEPEQFCGIDYVETLALRHTKEHVHAVCNPLELITHTFYLHVYQK